MTVTNLVWWCLMLLIAKQAGTVQTSIKDNSLFNATLFHLDKYKAGEQIQNGCFQMFNVTSYIVKVMQWRNAIVFYESEQKEMVSNFVRHFENEHVGFQTSLYDVSKLSPIVFSTLLIEVYQNTLDFVRVILFLGKTTLKLLKAADTLDESSNKTTDYQCNSRWIIIHQEDSLSEFMPAPLKIINIILFRYFKQQLQVYTFVQGRQTNIPCLNNRILSSCGGKLSTPYLDESACSVEHIFPQSIYNLNGRHLVIGTMASNAVDVYIDDHNRTFYSGILVELTEILSQRLNFTFSFRQADDGEFGGQDADGRWKGLVGMLHRREVDMVVADMSMSSERYSVVDFVLPCHSFGEWIIVRKRQLPQKWTQIFKSIQCEVYVTIAASLFLIVLLIVVLERFNYSGDLNAQVNKTRLNFSMVILLLGFLTVRGDGIVTKKATVRLLVFFVWMFCIVVTGVYVGNLTASLTDDRENEPFNNLKELVELSDWKWGTSGYALSQKIVQASAKTNSAMRKLWNGLVEFNKTDPDVLSLDITVHMQKVLSANENYAYFGWQDVYFTYLKNATDCSLKIMDAFLSSMSRGVAVPKNSYLKRYLETAMWKISDTGILEKLNDKRKKSRSSLNCSSDAPTRSFDLDDMSGAILVAGVGLSIATVILMSECFLKLFHKTTRG